MKIRILLIAVFVMFGFVIMNQEIHAQQPYSVPTTNAQPFYAGYGRFDQALYNVSPVSLITANTTYTALQSGTAIVINTSGGITVTLPPPTTPGMTFDVIMGTAQTSGTVKVITDAATTFVTGQVAVVQSNTSGNALSYTYACNGSSHVAIATNGSTTGGLIGSWLRFKSLTSTLWEVIGVQSGTGTPATPCSTS